MCNSDITFHMAFQNVLLLQLISLGVCVLSSTLSDLHREVCAWVVPTLISLLSIYICMSILIQKPQSAIEHSVDEQKVETKWNGVVYMLLLGLVLNVVYSLYNIVKQRTLESLWQKSR